MKRIWLCILILVAGVMTSCSTSLRLTNSTLPEVHLNVDDLEITEPVWAENTAVFVLCINWKRVVRSGAGDFIPNVYGVEPKNEIDLTDKAMKYALYKLMDAYPDYDMVMYPRFVVKKRRPFLGLGFIYAKIYVKVTARMARLKVPTVSSGGEK